MHGAYMMSASQCASRRRGGKALKSNESSAHPWMANSLADIKQAMLKEIGAGSIEELFEQIPVAHRLKSP